MHPLILKRKKLRTKEINVKLARDRPAPDTVLSNLGQQLALDQLRSRGLWSQGGGLYHHHGISRGLGASGSGSGPSKLSLDKTSKAWELVREGKDVFYLQV